MRGVPDDRIIALALSVTTVLVALIIGVVILAATDSLDSGTSERMVSILAAAVSAWIGGCVGYMLRGRSNGKTTAADTGGAPEQPLIGDGTGTGGGVA